MRSGYDMDKKLHNPTYINVQRTYWWQLQLINSKIASEIMSERKGEFLDREGHLVPSLARFWSLGERPLMTSLVFWLFLTYLPTYVPSGPFWKKLPI